MMGRMSQTSQKPLKYIEVSYAEPHLERTRKILEAHPEVRKLYGFTPSTAFYSFLLVVAQMVLAWVVSDQPWWVIALTAFCFGAVMDHAQFVVIHEATHNLIFKRTSANLWAGMMANLTLLVPAMIGFKKFHLLHHRNQGEFGKDADLSGPKEAAWVGRSTIRKAIWLFFFFVVEGIIRPNRLKDIKWVDGWFVVNLGVQALFVGTVIGLMGWGAMGYLALSMMFSIGLHPLGARWIQEHYVFKDNQETYSYYGPANKISFNVGHHNEHHDFLNIPWSRLPVLRKTAPEFYDTLYYHMSYFKLFFRFLFDPNVTLYSRVVRADGTCKKAIAQLSKSRPQQDVTLDRQTPEINDMVPSV